MGKAFTCPSVGTVVPWVSASVVSFPYVSPSLHPLSAHGYLAVASRHVLCGGILGRIYLCLRWLNHEVSLCKYLHRLVECDRCVLSAYLEVAIVSKEGAVVAGM